MERTWNTLAGTRFLALAGALALAAPAGDARAAVIGGVDLGSLTDYLFFFADGRTDANWQAASKGYVGDVAVDGLQADERTSGTVPYAGTISTNDTSLGAWQDIVVDNPGQAAASTGQVALVSGLESDLASAFAQVDALAASAGFAGVDSADLQGLDFQNGSDETIVINVTSGFGISTQLGIAGDAGDVFIMRWDGNADASDGYNGEVKFQSGGCINPLGDLSAANFVHVAGKLNASGGGTNCPGLPQGPRLDEGAGALITGAEDFNGGGFFTGYWLTTGDPDKDFENGSLSNAVFVGGWYTSNTKFSLTSGSSGVYVAPTTQSLPEPRAVLLLAAGVLLAAGARRRRPPVAAV